jgi:uncharacterized protein YbbK (DUF523 family)
MADKPLIAVSSCLLGNCVRYDGGHKRNENVLALREHFELYPVCPEAECGLGVPREPMRLIGTAGSPKLVTVETKEDKTRMLLLWVEKKILELAAIRELAGFVLKARSPSCGIGNVKISSDNRTDDKTNTKTKAVWTAGLFAFALKERFPGLAFASEEEIMDSKKAEEFIAVALRMNR